VPAWAIALWTDATRSRASGSERPQKIVNQHQREFGIAGRDGDRGVAVYTNNCPGGNEEIWEFWSQLDPRHRPHLDGDRGRPVRRLETTSASVCELLRTRNNNRSEPRLPAPLRAPEFVNLAADIAPAGQT
jgi:hypothetical protein